MLQARWMIVASTYLALASAKSSRESRWREISFRSMMIPSLSRFLIQAKRQPTPWLITCEFLVVKG